MLVLASGQDWVAVFKPEGVLSHPNDSDRPGKAVLRAPWNSREEFFNLDSGQNLGLCHRLDAPTSGVLLLAEGESLSWFRDAFEKGEMRKKYLAVVVGRPRQQRFVWRSRLAKRSSQGIVRVEVARHGVEAETKGREIGFCRKAVPLSLLELFPRTGRTHQLRVQAAGNGLPVLGDRNYGDFRVNRAFQKNGGNRRLFLHAAELSWKRNGEIVKVRTGAPQDFLDLFPDFLCRNEDCHGKGSH